MNTNTNTNANTWSDDVENVLEAIRENSVSLSNYHKERYYYYKSYLKFFKLPLIGLSSLTSIASVGLAEYMEQKSVSLITCILSLISATIASVELYLGIQKNMETEMITSRNYMLLAYDIYKTLSLTRDNRVLDGKHYLDEKYNDYVKLVENANLIKRKHIQDALAVIPIHAPKRPAVSSVSPYSNDAFLSPPPGQPIPDNNTTVPVTQSVLASTIMSTISKAETNNDIETEIDQINDELEDEYMEEPVNENDEVALEISEENEMMV